MVSEIVGKGEKMSEKIIAKYLDMEVEIPTENLLHIIFQIGKEEYRIQPEHSGDELNISTIARLIVYPRASNNIWLKTESW